MIEVKDKHDTLVKKHNELHTQLMEGFGYLEEGVINTEKLESENKELQEEREIFRNILRSHDQTSHIEDLQKLKNFL